MTQSLQIISHFRVKVKGFKLVFRAQTNTAPIRNNKTGDEQWNGLPGLYPIRAQANRLGSRDQSSKFTEPSIVW